MAVTLKARNVMRHGELFTVRPETSVDDLERMLVEHGISGAPVVNEADELVGLVSQRDIIELVHKGLTEHRNYYKNLDERLRSKKVKEIMKVRLHTVTPDTDLSTVTKILRTHHIHRVPVVEGKRLVGIVTTLDLIRPFEDPDFIAEIWGEGSRWRHWTPFRDDRSHRSGTPSGVR